MGIEEIRSIKGGRKELREFGITIGIVLGLLGGLLLWRGRDYYFYFFIISAILLFLGLATPFLLKPIHKTWMTLAILLGWLMTRIILSILFFLVITPIGFLTRLLGKDFLGLKFNRSTTNSYWIPKKAAEFKRENYERQF